jgi:hypothetical protein
MVDGIAVERKLFPPAFHHRPSRGCRPRAPPAALSSPAFYDLLRIAVAPAQLGRSSLHLDYRVVNERNGQEIFTARMVMVQVDLATETSRPWSTAFREALSRE